RLYGMQCSNPNDPSLFRGLANKCTSIRKLCIFFEDLENPNHGLAQLIENQKALKSIKFLVYNDDNYKLYDSQQLETKYQRINQAIIKHSVQLEYVVIPIIIIQSKFPELNNLRKLLLEKTYKKRTEIMKCESDRF